MSFNMSPWRGHERRLWSNKWFTAVHVQYEQLRNIWKEMSVSVLCNTIPALIWLPVILYVTKQVFCIKFSSLTVNLRQLWHKKCWEAAGEHTCQCSEKSSQNAFGWKKHFLFFFSKWNMNGSKAASKENAFSDITDIFVRKRHERAFYFIAKTFHNPAWSSFVH